MGLWTKDGSLIVSEAGSVIDCDNCPCGDVGCCDCSPLTATVSGFTGVLAGLNGSIDLTGSQGVRYADGQPIPICVYTGSKEITVTSNNPCFDNPSMETAVRLSVSVQADVDPVTCETTKTWSMSVSITETYDEGSTWLSSFATEGDCPIGEQDAGPPDFESWFCWPDIPIPSSVHVAIA